MNERRVIDPDVSFIKKVRLLGGESLKNCYQCATCSTVCNLAPTVNPFPRKEMIWAQWGLKDRLSGDPDVWLCHQCNDCSTQCPRGAKPGDLLAAIRKYMFEKFAFPAFMGKLVGKQSALPLLFLIPVILLLMVLAGTGHLNFPEGEVIYSKFLPIGTLQYFFMTGTFLSLFMFIIGVSRFWQAMNKYGTALIQPENKQNIFQNFFATVSEIISHKKFSDCGNNTTRKFAHLATFYGFIGLALTAGLGAVFEFGFGQHPPFPLLHPVKIVGNFSAVIFFIGSTILVVRRVRNHDKSGNTTYADRLFLYVIYVIGISGISLEIFRLSGIAWLAYSIYFIHLVCIFVLLVFAPYSKFAHVVFRTAALFWTRMNGRSREGD